MAERIRILVVPISVCLALAYGCGAAHSGVDAGHGIVSTAPARWTVPPVARFGDYDGDDSNRRSGSDRDHDDGPARRDGDGDTDGHGPGQYDSDDYGLVAFGKAARAVDKRAITSLVGRYLRTALGEEAGSLCSMLAPAVARAVPRLMPAAGTKGRRTCRTVMRVTLEDNSEQIFPYAATFHVLSVRVRHNFGIALLGGASLPSRQLTVVRNHGMWRVDEPLDGELP